MIPELGQWALILALIAAVLQGVVPIAGLMRNDSRLVAVGHSGASAVFALVVLSYVCLSWSFVENDFSVLYVASNSHSELPLMYRLSAVWGAHEGSLLLWILMLAGWSFAVSRFNRRLPADVAGVALAVLGLISVGFLLFTLLTSNPFERIFPVPLEGRDLNPLLQDPGLIIHPPMLYMGYVGFSVAFSFAIAALVSGRLDSAWARWTRPWTTTAWLFLTAGIVLGSWWAYHELGWGGWWFWDPVENASFMPWLVGTALIHSLAVTEKRGLLKSWTVLLAILAFSLSLLGTFLVRSGVLISVHAFATDPERGVFILAFLAVVVGGALSLYAWRAPQLSTAGEVRWFSREGLLLLNNVFLVVSAAAVLIGTLYPLLLDALGMGKVSVGPPYFNSVFIPLMAPLVILIGFASVMPWKRGRLQTVQQRLRIPLVLAVVIGVLLAWIYDAGLKLAVLCGSIMGCWALLTAFQDLFRRAREPMDLFRQPGSIWGMALAHAGIGVTVLGISFVSVLSVERDVQLRPGESADIAGYRFQFEGTRVVEGPNYSADRGTLRVFSEDEQPIAVLLPEKRRYRSQQQIMTDAEVNYSLARDLYASLGEPLNNGAWSLRLYYKPMMRLVWLGGILMVLGGILAASDRRYRAARQVTGMAVDKP